MTEGRRALYQQGINEAGPYQSPMEDGMLHFHEFLRRELEPHLKKNVNSYASGSHRLPSFPR